MKLFLKIFRMFLILFLIFFRKWCCDDEDDKKTKKTVRKRSKMIQERTKTVRKTETTKFEIICIFTRFLRSCAIIELSTPPPVDLKTQEKKNKKKQSVSQMKDLVMTMNSVQKSSKSELSSRGKRPFKVFSLCLFFPQMVLYYLSWSWRKRRPLSNDEILMTRSFIWDTLCFFLFFLAFLNQGGEVWRALLLRNFWKN